MKKIPLAPRRLLAVVALVVMLITAAVPAVSAEEFSGRIYDVTSDSVEINAINSTSADDYGNPTTWRIRYDPQKAQTPTEIHVYDGLVTCYPQPYDLTFASIDNIRHYYGTVNDGSQVIADVELEVIKNDFHAPAYGGFTFILYFDNWNTTYLNTLTNVRDFTFVMDGELPTYTISMRFIETPIPPELGTYLHHKGGNNYLPVSRVELIRYYYPLSYFEHEYTISTDEYGTTIDIIRNFATQNPSKLKVMLYNGDVIYESSTYETADQTYKFSHTGLTIDIITPDETYRILQGGNPDLVDPDPSPVNVYIRNSQTNALLANANLIISASVNGNLHEVVNETAPSGIYSIDLQPTGGGMPNPDFYRLIVTAEGYNSIMPYIDFEVDGATTIYAYLDPTGGAPEDENKTFIDFYVRDLAANGISGATVKFGGYTLITNSAGYTMFEVDKSKTYSWTVSKSGYGSLTGNAVIGSNARHTINTVLAPAVTPTIPTSIPTSTPISPTPTMTAPTGEPVSNWLEWFAAHFGMILGGGAEIGKIFMWLCFAVPVGVYVGKEAKAGAAGFMAGAGIVTLFFVLIGWVPIWLLVLLALIIGLLYAKIINNPDNGGGR